jgi:hypothetical protein
MAIKDVRQYFYTMLSQYLEEKQNLADFEAALKDGLITEDQMSDIMDTVKDLETNYHRLAYIMYLLEMPNRGSKKASYVRQYENILKALAELGADINSVKQENTDALIHFKADLKAVTDKDEQ